MHPVRLSEKAWNFVESRRGDMPAGDYVSKLIENVADLVNEGNLLPVSPRIVEEIDTRPPGYSPAGEDCGKLAAEIMGYLREAYHGKVPLAVFRKKCVERGLDSKAIEQAEHTYWQSLY